MLILGGDSSVNPHWKSDNFRSTFSGKWVLLEGSPVWVQVVSDGTKRNRDGKKVGGHELCAIPVLVNNQRCNLFVSCQYPSGKITIVGTAPQTDESGMPSGLLSELQKGDVVTPLYSAKTESTNWEPIPGAPIEIGDRAPKIEFGALPDGEYAYVFEFVNPVKFINHGTFTDSNARSAPVVFQVADGKVVDVEESD